MYQVFGYFKPLLTDMVSSGQAMIFFRGVAGTGMFTGVCVRACVSVGGYVRTSVFADFSCCGNHCILSEAMHPSLT